MRLGALIASDLSRSKGRLSVVGAAVGAGVAVLVLLGSIGLGIYQGLIEPLLPRLPLDLLKVEPRTISVGLLAFDASKLTGGLDERALDRLRAIEGVEAVYPIVGAAFPMRAEGGAAFLGHRIRTDIFATGIAPELVAADVGRTYTFEDPGEKANKVPVLVARRLLDLYNSTVAVAIDKPRLSPEAVIGFSFELELGASYARGTPDPTRVETIVAEIVGLSDQATLVGITIPEATLRRWNRRFARDESPVTGAYVKTRRPKDAGPVARAIELAGLRVDDTLKIIAAGIAIAGLIGALLAGAFLFLASFAIAQTFFLLVVERRSELAILRAMGARRRDLRRLVLAEAFLVGFLGGAFGVALGAAASSVVDGVVLALLPDVPFKPPHIIAFDGALIGAAWALGILAALLGAMVPAMRAARANPALQLRT